MIFFVSAFTLMHVIFYISIAVKWSRIYNKTGVNSNTFSIVIPVRNEEGNISNILRDIQNQNFPQDQFEVIVVDDFSDDGTIARLNEIREEMRYQLRIFQLAERDKEGKKSALTKGISKATNEIILTTDADCCLGSNWLKAFDKVFSKEIQIAAGPVALEGTGLFGSMQQTEFAGLVAFGATTLAANNPSMCSGANLAFRKSVFDEVGGYKNNINIASGDDEFLLYDVLSRHPNAGVFVKNQEAIVRTNTHRSYKSFFNQRARWVSKWKYNQNWKLRISAILFFLDYLSIIIAGIVAVVGILDSKLFFGLLIIRFLSNLILVSRLGKFLKISGTFLALLCLQIIYPFHVLIMGSLSIFGNYSWKGRKY